MNAQVKLIRESSGIIVGYEDAEGILYNNGSVAIVNMLDSHTIAMPTGDTLLVYNSELKECRYSTGDILFSIDSEDHILNMAGSAIGRVDDEGNVYGADGLLWANGSGIPRFKLAYYFFFANR